MLYAYNVSVVTVTARSGLVLRENSTTSSRKIITLPYGTTASLIKNTGPQETINGVRGKWIKIKYNNYLGWVFDGYVKYGSRSYSTAPRTLKPYNSGTISSSAGSNQYNSYNNRNTKRSLRTDVKDYSRDTYNAAKMGHEIMKDDPSNVANKAMNDPQYQKRLEATQSNLNNSSARMENRINKGVNTVKNIPANKRSNTNKNKKRK